MKNLPPLAAIGKRSLAAALLALAPLLPQPATAGATGGDNAALAQARAIYEAGEYRQAVGRLHELLAAEPDNSALHHLLGKAYGRLAENAVFWKAMKFAKKTRRAFEKAVELDAANIAAIEDLISYYESAPGFLGGSRQKAGRWRARLNELKTSS